jgi:hypothetical protein
MTHAQQLREIAAEFASGVVGANTAGKLRQIANELEALKAREPMTDEQTISVKVKRELFRFSSEKNWVNKAQSWYAKCGVPRGFYIAVDANGHVMHHGQCFMAATKADAYPVTCYELQTNWSAESHHNITNPKDNT